MADFGSMTKLIGKFGGISLSDELSSLSSANWSLGDEYKKPVWLSPDLSVGPPPLRSVDNKLSGNGRSESLSILPFQSKLCTSIQNAYDAAT